MLSIWTWREELSSLELRGSMERMTLAIGRERSSEDGLFREWETNAGHFMSHTALSALVVSTSSPPVETPLPLILLLVLLDSSIDKERNREREKQKESMRERIDLYVNNITSSSSFYGCRSYKPVCNDTHKAIIIE